MLFFLIFYYSVLDLKVATPLSEKFYLIWSVNKRQGTLSVCLRLYYVVNRLCL